MHATFNSTSHLGIDFGVILHDSEEDAIQWMVDVLVANGEVARRGDWYVYLGYETMDASEVLLKWQLETETREYFHHYAIVEDRRNG